MHIKRKQWALRTKTAETAVVSARRLRRFARCHVKTTTARWTAPTAALTVAFVIVFAFAGGLVVVGVQQSL